MHARRIMLNSAVALLGACAASTVEVSEVANHARCQGVNVGVSPIDHRQMTQILGTTLLNTSATQHEALAELALFVVFAGHKPTPGYRLQLNGASASDATVRLNYTWQTPPPDMIQAQVVTSPCSIVRLDTTERVDQVEAWIDGARLN